MATLNLISGTQANPARITGGTYNMLWGGTQHDCIVEDFKVISPPADEMPKLFNCDRITFRRGEIRGIRAGAGGHVEGIHINGSRDLLFEDVLFDDNDIFHVFITQYGGYAAPARIKFVRCRFGKIGPGGGYYSAKSHEVVTPVAGWEFVDCQRKGPVIWPADTRGAAAIQVVAANDPWPPFSGSPTPPPTPDPPTPPPLPDPTVDQRLASLEATAAALSNVAVALDARLDLIEAPDPLDKTAVTAAINKIKAKNPGIAAVDLALLALIEKLAER